MQLYPNVIELSGACPGYSVMQSQTIEAARCYCSSVLAHAQRVGDLSRSRVQWTSINSLEQRTNALIGG